MTERPAPAIRRTVFFSGNVQGVGFRAAACRIAAQHAVVGTVRNLMDGRVEVVVEGQVRSVDAFVDEIQGKLKQFIEHTTCTDSTAQGVYEGFQIKY